MSHPSVALNDLCEKLEGPLAIDDKKAREFLSDETVLADRIKAIIRRPESYGITSELLREFGGSGMKRSALREAIRCMSRVQLGIGNGCRQRLVAAPPSRKALSLSELVSA